MTTYLAPHKALALAASLLLPVSANAADMLRARVVDSAGTVTTTYFDASSTRTLSNTTMYANAGLQGTTGTFSGAFQALTGTFTSSLSVTGLGAFEEMSAAGGAFLVSNLGAITGITLNTGQGANELYAMDQAVRTTDNVTHANFNATGVANIGTSTGPGGTLDVAGNIYIDAATTPNYRIYVSSALKALMSVASSAGQTITTSITNDLCLRSEGSNIRFGFSGTERFRVESDGDGWFDGNLVANSYADGTPGSPYTPEQSLALLEDTTTSTTGHIDHDTLPPFARVNTPISRTFWFETLQEARDTRDNIKDRLALRGDIKVTTWSLTTLDQPQVVTDDDGTTWAAYYRGDVAGIRKGRSISNTLTMVVDAVKALKARAEQYAHNNNQRVATLEAELATAETERDYLYSALDWIARNKLSAQERQAMQAAIGPKPSTLGD